MENGVVDKLEDRFNIGDLVMYQANYVIPPNAINYKWKDAEPTTPVDNLGIVVDIDKDLWRKRMYTAYDEAIYKIYWVKSGHTSYVPSYNLKKAYGVSAYQSKND